MSAQLTQNIYELKAMVIAAASVSRRFCSTPSRGCTACTAVLCAVCTKYGVLTELRLRSDNGIFPLGVMERALCVSLRRASVTSYADFSVMPTVSAGRR